MSVAEMEQYKKLVEHSAKLSSIIHKNYASLQEILDKINQSEFISSEKLQELNLVANSISQASNSLSDEKTLAGLKHLEAIVVKK